MPNFKQFISSHKIISIIIALIVVTIPISTIAFFKNKTSNSSSQIQLQLVNSQSSVVSSSSSNYSSVSSSLNTTSSTSSSSNSTQEESKVFENSPKPEINSNITSQLPNLAPNITENKVKIVADAKVNFNKTDIDDAISYFRNLVNLGVLGDETKMKALEADPEFKKWSEILKNLSTNSDEFQKQDPDQYSKFKSFETEIMGVVSKQLMSKFEKEMKIAEEESKRLAQKCKMNNTGYEYINLDINGFNNNYSVFESKVKVTNRSKQSVQNVIEDIKSKCVEGTYKFFDSSTIDYNLGFYPKYVVDESGNSLVEEKYNHFLAQANIKDKQTTFFEYYPDFILKVQNNATYPIY
jgi:hypothetical protein